MFISLKESRIENNRTFYGSFNLGYFPPGHSLTVANALRRTLLSECTGLAIISVKIENVHHEYSTLPGVRDSVLDILLNLKEIVLKKTNNPTKIYKKKGSSFYDEFGNTFFKPVVGYLKKRGPGVIRAKDLRLPPFIQCVDPSQYITTLAEDGYLNLKFVIMEGKGYIIRKSNLLTHENIVLKQRQVLLNQLKDFMKKSKDNDTKDKNNENEKRGLKTNLNLKKGSLVVSDSSSKKGRIVDKKKIEKDSFVDIPSSTVLNLDAVFNPVTKVNYVIEENQNNWNVYSLYEKQQEFKNLYSFIQNNLFLEKNINNNKENSLSTDYSVYVDALKTYTYNSDYSEDSLTHSIQYNVKDSIKQHIILEIWTNGSIHPRDALIQALKNLSYTFLGLQRSKIYNPIYKDLSSYKKAVKPNILSSPFIVNKTNKTKEE